jgi:hypothetical protein
MRETIADHFARYFGSEWDGQYHTDFRDRTPGEVAAREDFCQLTNNAIIWTQIHGDFKNAAKRATFTPYPHWAKLHECCRDAVREHSALGDDWIGDFSAAKLMHTAMQILKKRYDINAPRFWLPMIRQLRDDKTRKPENGQAPKYSAGQVLRGR